MMNAKKFSKIKNLLDNTAELSMIHSAAVMKLLPLLFLSTTALFVLEGAMLR
jgi:hypothetical protein